MVEKDPIISEAMRKLNARRKNKRGGFADKEFAKKMGVLGREAKRIKRQKTSKG